MTNEELIEKYLEKEVEWLPEQECYYWTENSSIVDGRPISPSGGHTTHYYKTKEEIIRSIDAYLFTDLSEEEQKICLDFYKELFFKTKSYNHLRSSYGLKHYVQYFKYIYMTNNQFKDMMLKEGYLPRDVEELNWEYQIHERVLSSAINKLYERKD